MRYTTFAGIYFVEGTPKHCQRLGQVSVEVGGAFEHAQLRSLDDVKRALADKVKAHGGNAVIAFDYGQKSVGAFRSLFHLDDVAWYGKGEIAIVPTKQS